MQEALVRRKIALALLACFAFVSPVLAWGHTGHSMINGMAVDLLPDGPLKKFFQKHKDYIVQHAIDPDNYKKQHHAEEGPKHFLNMCSGGIKAEDYPRTWKACVDKWGAHQATKQGKLPWTIQEFTDDLVAAFKAKDGTKIIEKATWLGHYVGDAHVPFHACANFDGQESGQKGIHAMWESAMLDHNTDAIRAAAEQKAKTMQVSEITGDITAWAFDRLIAGDHACHEILQKDKGNRSSGREKALYKATGDIAEKRIAEAATGLASIWLTAYAKAGKPALPDNVKLGEGVKGDGNDEDGREEPKNKGEPPKMDSPKPEEPKQDQPAEKPAEQPKANNNDKPSANAKASGIQGLSIRDDDDQPGAIVDFVESGTAAASSGLLKGDVIVQVDGNPVNSCSTFASRLKDFKSGEQVGITVLRSGTESYVKIRVP